VMRRVVEVVRGRAFGGDGTAGLDAAATLLQGLLMDLEAGAQQPGGARNGTQLHHYRLAMELAGRISEDPAAVPPVEQLAASAGYSPDHFTRVFRQVIGQTPQEFALRQRLARARQLLMETSFTIEQISRVLGYRDVGFFSRQFKQKIGQTPGRYRRARRPDGSRR
jgi:AraC family transcriptional regulator, arabinose operon regulatory protein